MSRLPVAAFVALAIATVAAFFVTQHLKVTTPIVTGDPMPHPSTINPIAGGTCLAPGPKGKPVETDFRQMKISFYLLNRSDDVDVYILDSAGNRVRQIGSDVHMVGGKDARRHTFTWNGRRSDGSLAPDGTYEIQVSLVHQGREYVIANQNSGAVEPVTVQTRAPVIRVASVTAGGGAIPAVIPQSGSPDVTIRYSGTGGLRPQIVIYRAAASGRLTAVKHYFATTSGGSSVWDGTLQHKRAAPAGTYLVGLRLKDATCNTVSFPQSMHPAPGSTAHAGVTVRYLAAQPPMVAVRAGAVAAVEVDSRRHRYEWALRGAGSAHVLRSGSSSAVTLPVRLPAGAPGLYDLALRWGLHRTVVPLVASAPASSGAKVLVVLPSLTWQGLNPVDDDGDGIPNTLLSGEPIRLQRPFADGLPGGFRQESALIGYLRRARLTFDLTTDLDLILDGHPALSGYSGVVLAGDERWLPASEGTALARYVQLGGHVLSLGIGSLQRQVTVTASSHEALDPGRRTAIDALQARPRSLKRSRGALILVDRDRLHLFRGTSQALSGYRSYQPFGPVQAPARLLTTAGVSSSSPAVIGYRLGSGDVVDIGVPRFAASLTGNVDARELLGNVWRLLSH